MRHRFVLAPVLLGALAVVGPAVQGALSPTTGPGAAQSQAAVAPAAPAGAGLDPVVLRRAEALVRQYAVIDAHAHDPGKPASPVFPRQVTLPLMVERKLGGLVQVVPFSPLPSDHPVDTILADLRRLKSDLDADARVALVLTSDGFVRNRSLGRPSVMLGVEYFQGLLDGRVETLDTYYKEGVRVVGLSHAAKDLITEGEGETRTLTTFGRKVVEAMNALGIACDVTHLPDVVRRQVIAASRAPILVSHGAARSLVPSPFNVDDETLDQLAASNGLVGVTFCSEQLSKETLAQKAHVQDPTRLPPARVQDVVDQIDYLRKRVGIHRVALGTDFGGSGRMAPAGLGTIEGLPLLAYHMLERGYSEQEIGQVLGRNLVDFLGRVERAARSARPSGTGPQAVVRQSPSAPERPPAPRDFSGLSGPYLGQAPPGSTPQVFAPNAVSTAARELNSVFTPDGREFYFTIQGADRRWTIMRSALEDGRWTAPAPASFSGRWSDVDLFITADGRRLYFCSNRPVDGDAPKDFDIWVCERDGEGAGWREPHRLEAPINSPAAEFYPTLTRDGTMYFQSQRAGGPGAADIWRARLRDGRYVDAECLPGPVNTSGFEGDALIAPDESYLIVSAGATVPASPARPPATKPGGATAAAPPPPPPPSPPGLFLSVPRADGTWSPLVSLGDAVNPPDAGVNCQMLSPDGRYLFFTRGGDIYWVDAAVIVEAKRRALAAR